MSYPAGAAAGGYQNGTPQQQYAALHQQQQQAAYARARAGTGGTGGRPGQPPQAGAGAATAAGGPPPNKVENLSDANEGYQRSIKRRKPTDRSLPSFVPSIARSSSDKVGPTEAKLAASTTSLQSMAESYKRLQAAERKLDWNLARRRVELAETVNGSRTGGVKRTLRIHLTSKLIDQPWQLPLGELRVPSPKASDAPAVSAEVAEGDSAGDGLGKEDGGKKEGEEDKVVEGEKMQVEGEEEKATGGEGQKPDGEPTSVEPPAPEASAADTPAATIDHSLLKDLDDPAPKEGEGQKKEGEASAAESSEKDALAPDFATGKGVPRFQLSLTGELLPGPGAPEDEKSDSEGFTKYLKRIVIEFPDRDPNLYDKTGPIDWRKLPNITPSALTFSLPASTKTIVRLAFYLNHKPDHFSLVPEVAMMLDMAEGDRVSVLQALWGYVRMQGLVDEEKKVVRCDPRMRKLFSGQESVPFHHLPEYVNRWLIPQQPVYLDYVILTDESSGETKHSAFDFKISVEDPVRAEMEKVAFALNQPDPRAKEMALLDEKIALDALAIRQTYLKRTFLTAFSASPQSFLTQWLASQSSDLTSILPGGSSTFTKDEMRRSEKWQGEWVAEGARVHAMRSTEQSIREQMGKQQQQAMMQQQQFMQSSSYGRR
ncbi:hypothetical protein T439DRAFT_376903 [Meredithblackwellia eburnea MCA 4105]